VTGKTFQSESNAKDCQSQADANNFVSVAEFPQSAVPMQLFFDDVRDLLNRPRNHRTNYLDNPQNIVDDTQDKRVSALVVPTPTNYFAFRAFHGGQNIKAGGEWQVFF